MARHKKKNSNFVFSNHLLLGTFQYNSDMNFSKTHDLRLHVCVGVI